jgi:ubiquinol-cytochrome c reductase cytochrome b subunit
LPRPLEYPRDAQGVPQTDKPPVPNAAPNLYGFAGRDWIRGLLDPAKIAAAKIDTDTWHVKDAPYFGNTNHRGFDSDSEEDHAGQMAQFVKENLAKLDDAHKSHLEQVVVALSAEAELPAQKELDAKAKRDGTIEAGRKALAEVSWNDVSTCVDCHKFHDKGEAGIGPDLTGYGSRSWLIEFISDPSHERFYGGKHNDRMPAFAKDKTNPKNNLLTPGELELIVKWLRQEWYEPPAE